MIKLQQLIWNRICNKLIFCLRIDMRNLQPFMSRPFRQVDLHSSKQKATSCSPRQQLAALVLPWTKVKDLCGFSGVVSASHRLLGGHQLPARVHGKTRGWPIFQHVFCVHRGNTGTISSYVPDREVHVGPDTMPSTFLICDSRVIIFV